ncbi:long-chain-fatty-acid--CoA ligase [Burkholderia contaminans]|nr:long-chain-fatty-acid--CoA ligase [Burkholderia contaminans]
MLDTGIADILRSHAAVRPEHAALIFRGQRTNYIELNRRASQVANGLLAADVKPQERVAILDYNSDQFYEVWLGAARANAVLVPLNARLSADEVAQVLNDCEARVVFIGAAFQELLSRILPGLGSLEHVIVTGDSYVAWREANADVAPRITAKDSDVCVQIYTSGTTGVAKGVQLTNVNAMAPFRAASEGRGLTPWASYGPADVALQCLPHGHIAGCGFGVGALYAGAVQVIMPDFVPAEIIATIQREQVTRTVMVPTMLRAIVEALRQGNQQCPSLRSIIYTGAPMATASLQQGMTCFPEVEFGQIYGLTETTGPITYLDGVDHAAIAAGNAQLALSCGRATVDVEMRVVDADGYALPAGGIGEIVCRAPQVMKGYWNRPQETADCMKDGWFYSGDVGHMDEHGYFYVHDRKRDMIISGGENIYPTEVENALYGHPAILEAVVFGVPDEKWGEAVKALIVLKPDQTSTAESILAYARQRIAGFKLPKSIDFVETLPRNATGKILRRAAREPYWKGRGREVA